MLTRVELGEEVDEVPHLLLLGARGALRVVGRHGVQEGPGAAAQLLAVQGAVGGRLLLLHRCLREGRERAVGAAEESIAVKGWQRSPEPQARRGENVSSLAPPGRGKREGAAPQRWGRGGSPLLVTTPAHIPPYHAARRRLLPLLAEPALEIRTGPARLLRLLLRSGAGSPGRDSEMKSKRAAFSAGERRGAAARPALTGRRHLGAAVHCGPEAAASFGSVGL